MSETISWGQRSKEEEGDVGMKKAGGRTEESKRCARKERKTEHLVSPVLMRGISGFKVSLGSRYLTGSRYLWVRGLSG